MNAPLPPSALLDVDLEDKYTQDNGRVFLTGTQALIRLLILQRQRDQLAVEIRAKASGVSVGIATVEDIDRINIYHAALLAMRRAVEGLPRKPQHVLVDARTVPGIEVPQNSFNLEEMERETIKAALAQCGGVVASAAKLLGIDRRTLQRKLKRLS